MNHKEGVDWHHSCYLHDRALLPHESMGFPEDMVAEIIEKKGLKEQVEELERALISEALQDARGVQTKAAKALGVSERILRYKVKKYQLK